MKLQVLRILILNLFLNLFFLSCLQTRSGLGSNQQSQVYHKKNIENQMAEADVKNSEAPAQKIDDRDEVIRALNGRVESLESQIQAIQNELMQKEKQTAQAGVSSDSQKISLLQEALSKMESQIQKLEGNEKPLPQQPQVVAHAAPPVSTVHSGVKNNTKSKLNGFDIAEDYFQKKEWKKAILSYQSYVEEFSKGKSVPEAKYKIGVCFQELGLKDEAAAFYEEVVAQFPKSDFGKKSKIRLTSLNSKKTVK